MTNDEIPNYAATSPTNSEAVRCDEWLGDMRANVAAGLRAARRHKRLCHANNWQMAWAHRKGEIAALRGIARLLKTPMSPSAKLNDADPSRGAIERKP
jgi:hypothetical protein